MRTRFAITSSPQPSLPPSPTLRRCAIALSVAGALGTPAAAQELPQVVINAGAEEPYAPSHASVGGKTPLRLVDIPQSVTVFSAERIADQNLFTLGDLMQQAPGVSVLPFDGANPDFRARGYGMELSYDGIPASLAGSGQQEFELAIYDRVEILRGPSGVTAGAGQPGGVINFVRKRGARAFQAAGAASAGSHDNRRLELDVGGPLNAAGTLRGRAVATWQDRDYFHATTHDRKWLGYVALDADLGRDTTLSLAHTRQLDRLRSPSMGLPAYTDGRFFDVDRATHVYPDWNRMWWATSQGELELAHRLASGWELRARAVRRTLDKFYKDGYPSTGVDRASGTATYARRMADLDFERQAADLYASGPFALFGRRHSLTLGYAFDRRTADSLAVTYAAVPRVDVRNPASVPEPTGGFERGSSNRVTQGGAYAQARLSLAEPLTLAIGARSTSYRNENRNIAPSAPSAYLTSTRERGEVSPSAALLWQLAPGANLYLSYADIFFPQAQMDAARRTLDPRVGSQLEAGAKGSFLGGRLTAAAAVFSIRERNRALATDVADVYVPSGEVEVEGVEFEVGGRPLPDLNLSAGYTWLSTKYGTHPTLEGTAWSTFEPKHSAKLYARWQPAWLRGVFLGGGVTANSRLLGSGTPGIREQGGWAVANAQLGYAPNPRLAFTLAINNVFDRTYWARVGGLNTYNTYGEPRSILLSVRGSYQ